jgi:hypothetical protein
MQTGPCVSWRIDHMLYSTRTLTPTTVWEALEADPVAKEAGLPCKSCPSDHLPIAAAFNVGHVVGIAAARKAELKAAVEQLTVRHQAAAKALQQTHQAAVRALEQSEAAEKAAIAAAAPVPTPTAAAAAARTAASAVAGTGEEDGTQMPQKKRQKKKGAGMKPSDAAVMLTRGQRDEVKQLRVVHLAERGVWIAKVSVDALEHEYVGWELLPPEWLINGMLQ